MPETVTAATPAFVDRSVNGRLLVFAHEAEAQSFVDIPHLVTGIGKVSAAAGLAAYLAGHAAVSSTHGSSVTPVKEVIVLGTAGVLDDGLSLDTVYRVSRAIQHDLAFPAPTADLHADGRVKLSGAKTGIAPVTLAASSAGSRAESATAATFASSVGGIDTAGGVETAIIATGDAFVTDDDVRASLAGQGAGLVDMESYAYARTCAGIGVPLKIFKVGSDYADSQTTDETWDQIVARKSAQLFAFASGSGLI